MTQDPQLPRPGEMLDMTVRAFTAATAAKAPIPGGGSVAGVVGALAAALGEMSVAFTRGKKQFVAFDAEHGAIAQRLARARGMLADLTSDDASAYLLYQEATRCADDTKPAKTQAALAAAINVPRDMAKVLLAALADLRSLGEHCNRWLLSDLAAAGILAAAAVRLCDYNVRTNANSVPDAAAANELRQASAADCVKAARLRGEIEEIVGRAM